MVYIRYRKQKIRARDQSKKLKRNYCRIDMVYIKQEVDMMEACLGIQKEKIFRIGEFWERSKKFS